MREGRGHVLQHAAGVDEVDRVGLDGGEVGAGGGELGRGRLLGVTGTGRALLQGEDLLTMKPERLRQVRGPGAGMVFQDPMTSLNPVLTVGRQLTEGMEVHLGLGRGDARERAVELLTQVGIPSPRERLRAYPHQLSGGMRQRLAAAGGDLSIVTDSAGTQLRATVPA